MLRLHSRWWTIIIWKRCLSTGESRWGNGPTKTIIAWQVSSRGVRRTRPCLPRITSRCRSTSYSLARVVSRYRFSKRKCASSICIASIKLQQNCTLSWHAVAHMHKCSATKFLFWYIPLTGNMQNWCLWGNNLYRLTWQHLAFRHHKWRS